MTTTAPPVLFVHAHPDDETLTTGLTMAALTRDGHPVHVLTCTLGEEGEVIPPALLHLDAEHDDTLGPYRREELRAAMAALGVSHEVLGEDPRAGRLSVYRDSGMAGPPRPPRPEAFALADPDEAVARVCEVIARIRPAVVVTYDRHGGYLHPDHIQTHRVTCAAVASMAPDDRPLLYAVLTPQSWAREDRRWLADHLPADFGWSLPDPDGPYPPAVVADDLVTHEVVRPDLVPTLVEALRHHETQVSVRGPFYALSNDIAARVPSREGFALLDPATGDLETGAGAAAPGRRHTNLLGGRA